MSRIRGKNTAEERLVFGYLRTRKIHFQRHYHRVAGCPDVAVPRKKRAVFINGDFWHGRRYKPTTKKLSKFWRDKIASNVARDKRNIRALRKIGWRVLVVWSSDLERKKERTLEEIADFITGFD